MTETPSTVRVEQPIYGAQQLVVRAPYELRFKLSDIPGAKWSSPKKAWTYPVSAVTAASLADVVGPAAFEGSPHAQSLLEEGLRQIHSSASKIAAAADAGDLEPLPFPTTIPLWAHQLGMIRFAEPLRAVLWNVGMGAGKTAAAIQLIRLRKHAKTLVIAPLSVVPAWAKQASIHAPNAVTVVALNEGPTPVRALLALNAWQKGTPEKPVIVVTNYECGWSKHFQTAISQVKDGLDMMIADECCDKGTLISTPNGDKTIESLNIGDIVYGYDHETNKPTASAITHCFSRVTESPSFRFGTAKLTGEHPVWLEKSGYIPVKFVDDMDVITLRLHNENDRVSVVQETVHCHQVDREKRETEEVLQHQLLSEVANVATRSKEKSVHPRASGEVQNFDAKNEVESRMASETCSLFEQRQESISKLPKRGLSENSTPEASVFRVVEHDRREREWTDSSAKGLVGSVGRRVGNGVSNCNSINKNENGRSSYKLQSGFSEPIEESCDRSGWGNTQLKTTAMHRQEKRKRTENVGLDGSEDKERRGIKRTVYNIETNTSNYFANGLLVHNCHRLKAPGGKQSVAYSKISAEVPYKLGLSGTPLPNSPMDGYGIFRFLDPGIFGRSFVAFRTRYAKMGGFQGKQVIGYQNKDDFARRIAPFTYEVDRSVLDLPPSTHLERVFELNHEAMAIYKAVRDEFIASVDAGKVTVTNALTKLLRLSQIASGSVGLDLSIDDYDEEGGAKNREVREIHTQKQEILREILEEIDPKEPVVVFARFKNDLEQIRKAAQGLGGVAELSGSRNELAAWQTDGGPRVLAAQIQSGAEGIDLTRACYCVYFSKDYSRGRYLQSLARSDRPGQTRPVTYIHIIAEKTTDRLIMKALDKKGALIEEVLEEIRKWS